jgi:hypothetical protein
MVKQRQQLVRKQEQETAKALMSLAVVEGSRIAVKYRHTDRSQRFYSGTIVYKPKLKLGPKQKCREGFRVLVRYDDGKTVGVFLPLAERTQTWRIE